MKKSFKKTLSLFLALTMIVSGMGISVLASDIAVHSPVALDIDNIEQQNPNITDEIISKRTSHSKVFSTDDGGYYTVVSATPIHILDQNGEFQNIEEPTVELTTEEVITEYVATVAETYNSAEQLSTYSYNITEQDQLVYNASSLIKCFSPDGIDNTGYFVKKVNNKNTIVCIKPVITSGNILITSAKLTADALGIGDTSNNYITSKIISNQWDDNTTSMPSTIVRYFDCVNVAKSSNTTAVSWNITHLMNMWQLGLEENFGFALVPKKSNCNVSLSNLCLSYYYHEINELDDNFTYETINIGNAGTVYINHYSCIPTLQFNDIGIEGEKTPVFISHSYNPLTSRNATTYGNQFRLNYYSTIKYSNQQFEWNNTEGEYINFTLDDEFDTFKTYKANDSKYEYELRLYKDVTNNNYNPNKFDNIVITNKTTNEEYSFESHSNSDIGYLKTIKDGSLNQNVITIGYNFISDDIENSNYISNNIQWITDGVGRKYMFNYETNGVISYLDSINVFYNNNDSYEPIIVGNHTNSEPYNVKYTYQISNNVPYLTSVEHVGENNISTYTYDNSNRLISISNGIKTLTLTYDNNLSNKVSSYSIKKIHNEKEIELENIIIDSSLVYQRIFTNMDGEKKIINYDEKYNTVYYKDYDGTIFTGITTNGETEYILNDNNQNNLIQNGNFETNDDILPMNWELDCEDGSAYVDEKINNYALTLTGSLSDTVRVYQQITAPQNSVFKAGESYAYGGLAQAKNALTTNGNGTFGIYIFNAITEENKLVPNQCISYFDFDSTLYNVEQHKMSYFTLKQDTPALFVYICFDYNCDNESAYFDNIELFKYTPLNINEDPSPYETEYNNNNSIITEKLNSKNENSNSYLATLYNYDNSCNLNYISEINDEKGITTYYKYDPNNGRLISTSNNSTELNSAAAKTFEYTASGLLSSVKQTVTNTVTGNTVEMKTEYAYSNDMLTSVTHNGFSYNFVYDAYGNITSIGVSTQETPLVTTTYVNARKCLTDTITYANGCQIDYTYDIEDTDRITKIDYIKSDGTIFKSLQYNYDAEGNLSSAIDEKANVKITYNENSYSYILTDNNNETVLYQSNVDDTGNTVETFTQGMNGATTTVISTPSLENTIQSEQIESKSEQLLSRVESVDGVDKNINYSFDKSSITDEFDRLQSSKINSVYQIGSDSFAVNSEDTYTYKSNGDREFTLVDSYTTVKSIGERNENGTLKYNSGEVVTTDHYNFTFNYAYDSSGNITKVYLTDNVNNTFVNFLYCAYKYDNANQLIFEYSPTKNCCIAYDYDAGGNIIEKRVYNLSAYDQTNDTVLPNTQYESIVFSYDSNYKDRLISVDNAPIQYDNLGNPINYDPANGFFEWNGRLLTAFETNGAGNRYEYEYDEQGLRVRKIIYDKKLVAGTTDEYTYEKTNSLEYIWDNGKLKGVSFTNTQTNTSSFMNLIYDEAGIAQGYIGLSGNPYYFVRDALGNVVYVISPIDDLSITVFYDAWGNPTLQSSSYDDIGMQIATLFIYYFNPSTYKGYLYDYETGLYYCQSRYYSPVWSRFINMDDVRILNLTQGDTLGNNLYAYCNNNPVNYIDTTGYWAEKYPGFEWTNNGFKLSVHPNFLKKSFCLEYAADILAIVKSNKYKSMSQKRMAVELYFHAAIYYIMDPFVVLGLNGALINKLHTSAKMMDINNNDYRVVFFYLVWNSL